MQVAGSVNPVAGPFFNVSVPEPVGVVGIVAPQDTALLGLVSVLAPVLVSGCAAVVIASETRPLPAVTLAEVLATSDVPAGVVNMLTGRTLELAPVLAGHLDVDGIDLTGLAGTDTSEVEIAAAENVKRVLGAPATEPDWRARPPGARRIVAWTDTKTVWHPKGP
jgi:acyl-CoA reductase-like NAD-dependent aldehyde dehydrogenase